MPKKKSSSSLAFRLCQSCFVIIVAIIIFFIMLFIQDTGFDVPFLNVISFAILLLAVLIAIGIIAGKCQPSSWRSWDMLS